MEQLQKLVNCSTPDIKALQQWIATNASFYEADKEGKEKQSILVNLLSNKLAALEGITETLDKMADKSVIDETGVLALF